MRTKQHDVGARCSSCLVQPDAYPKECAILYIRVYLLESSLVSNGQVVVGHKDSKGTLINDFRSELLALIRAAIVHDHPHAWSPLLELV